MTSSNISGESTGKINEILKAAQKRFGQFGLEKTTLREIASDLNMTKSSLYYYFPDKEHLFKAVVEQEQNEFIAAISDKIKKLNDAEEMLKEYVRLRFLFFKSLLNLSRLRLENFKDLKPILGDIWTYFRSREAKIIIYILEKEIEKSNPESVENVEETALLFLDLLSGLHNIALKKNEINILEPEVYNKLAKRADMFTRIFIRGFRNNN
ncbi:MAG: TetR/AcrR family transcriptional regulator [Bacteroidota bacterium]|nr:TetR/AcrR family transcriptional regulator [Bacteroidota bacterium]